MRVQVSTPPNLDLEQIQQKVQKKIHFPSNFPEYPHTQITVLGATCFWQGKTNFIQAMNRFLNNLKELEYSKLGKKESVSSSALKTIEHTEAFVKKASEAYEQLRSLNNRVNELSNSILCQNSSYQQKKDFEELKGKLNDILLNPLPEVLTEASAQEYADEVYQFLQSFNKLELKLKASSIKTEEPPILTIENSLAEQQNNLQLSLEKSIDKLESLMEDMEKALDEFEVTPELHKTVRQYIREAGHLIKQKPLTNSEGFYYPESVNAFVTTTENLCQDLRSKFSTAYKELKERIIAAIPKKAHPTPEKQSEQIANTPETILTQEIYPEPNLTEEVVPELILKDEATTSLGKEPIPLNDFPIISEQEDPAIPEEGEEEEAITSKEETMAPAEKPIVISMIEEEKEALTSQQAEKIDLPISEEIAQEEDPILEETPTLQPQETTQETTLEQKDEPTLSIKDKELEKEKTTLQNTIKEAVSFFNSTFSHLIARHPPVEKTFKEVLTLRNNAWNEQLQKYENCLDLQEIQLALTQASTQKAVDLLILNTILTAVYSAENSRNLIQGPVAQAKELSSSLQALHPEAINQLSELPVDLQILIQAKETFIQADLLSNKFFLDGLKAQKAFFKEIGLTSITNHYRATLKQFKMIEAEFINNNKTLQTHLFDNYLNNWNDLSQEFESELPLFNELEKAERRLIIIKSKAQERLNVLKDQDQQAYLTLSNLLSKEFTEERTKLSSAKDIKNYINLLKRFIEQVNELL